MSVILSNQVVCHVCQDAPFSRNRHDFRYCKCGNVAVDGGQVYLRRVGTTLTDHTDISISVEDETYAELAEAMKDEKTNDLGKICAIARILRDSGVLYGTEPASEGHITEAGDAPERREAGAAAGLLSQGS